LDDDQGRPRGGKTATLGHGRCLSLEPRQPLPSDVTRFKTPSPPADLRPTAVRPGSDTRSTALYFLLGFRTRRSECRKCHASDTSTRPSAGGAHRLRGRRLPPTSQRPPPPERTSRLRRPR